MITPLTNVSCVGAVLVQVVPRVVVRYRQQGWEASVRVTIVTVPPPPPPQSPLEYKHEYGTSSKETRRYKFDSLSDLALVPLDPMLDALEAAVEKVDRQEFVSLLSGLLRLGDAARLTPEQALHKPFITQHHLAVHTNVPM